AQGNLEGALAYLEKAVAVYRRGRMTEVAPLEAYIGRIWIAQGELDLAWQWAHKHQLAAEDAPNYLREFEHLTLARLLIAQYRSDQKEDGLQAAKRLLDRLLLAAEAGGRTASVIEILLLQALADEAHDRLTAALPAFNSALMMAEPEYFTSLFVNEGLPVVNLLQAIIKENRAVPYAVRLLAYFETESTLTAAPQPLVDPLSERELEILNLIAAGFRNKEIAAQLVISLNTVLYHNKNIYSKLGVNKRALAIIKARELNLIQ
ncbi:MAG: hypothetical protein KDE51_16435, partial [Anaerolineales bacterium]|nr:hypothetical protein [Anaerolineales bacterium]